MVTIMDATSDDFLHDDYERLSMKIKNVIFYQSCYYGIMDATWSSDYGRLGQIRTE